VRELRGRLPQAIYESGRSQVSVRVAEDAKERFPDILAAADAVLAATGTRE
jgi:transcription-repair coupling factor (superfamily II helicase)